MKAKTNRSLDHYRAILFDMDGVLIDSEPVHQETLIRLSRHLGKPFTAAEAERFKGMTEKSTALRLKQLFPACTGTAEELIAERMAMYLKAFDLVQAMPHAREFLEQCRRGDVRMALVTSSPTVTQRLACDKFGYNEYFEIVTTGEDVIEGKPSPEPYLRTAALLDIDPSECLVIEDSINGVRSGKAAGCQVLGLTTSFSRDDLFAAGADDVIDSFRDIVVAGKVIPPFLAA